MSQASYFPYGETEIQYLKERDPKLKEVITHIGHIQRAVEPDIFKALLKYIVGQQISTKAQETICQRIEERCAPITPFHIYAIAPETLQGCGMSMRKTAYIQEMAEAVVSGELRPDTLNDLSDEEVIAHLCRIKGIGKWTAEMLLLFSCLRPDVVSFDDLAIIRGMRMVYRHRKITPALFAKYRRRYAPYGSVASLYLWAVAGGAVEGLTDPGASRK